MIGQVNLQSQIRNLIENDSLPRFIILVGERGSGTDIFANVILTMIQEKSGAVGVQLPDVKAETVRAFTSDAYKFAGMTNVIMIIDADKMSSAAQNALLKVTEEPPNDTYFIMTLEDENNTLETIKSRATIFHMDKYTPDEIIEYAIIVDKGALHDISNRETVKELCSTPGEVDILLNSGIKEFNEYVQLVVDNIAEVSTANSFKIADKVALKDDVEGYDLKLFWKAFIKKCLVTDKIQGIFITSRYLRQLRVKGVNKQMLMDNWIIDIREAWRYDE